MLTFQVKLGRALCAWLESVCSARRRAGLTVENTEPYRPFYPCPDCMGGIRHVRHITYFTWLKQQLITVPNFPAWICDACGRRTYDPRAISRLYTLLHSPEMRDRPASDRSDLQGRTEHPTV